LSNKTNIQIFATYVFQRPGSVPDSFTCIRPEAARETKTKKLLFRDCLKAFGEGVSPGLYVTQLNEQKATNFN